MAAPAGIDLPAGLGLPPEHGHLGLEGVAPGVVLAGRKGNAVHLLDGVGGAVDLDVKAGAKEVLVVGGCELGCHEAGKAAGVARADGHRRHDPGQLHLELDSAVEVEVPVEAVLVVAHGGDELTTSRRDRRTSGRRECMSTCFQRMP